MPILNIMATSLAKLSGFIQENSTINQIISMCNQLYKTLDNGDEIIGVFLDLTKAFDKVRHKGLIYKIDKYDNETNLQFNITIPNKVLFLYEAMQPKSAN